MMAASLGSESAENGSQTLTDYSDGSAESSSSVPNFQSGQWQDYISSRTSVCDKRTWKDRDPVSIERSNLVNICKLVVKELIESSLRYGRNLDSDSVPLQHFFIVLEHVLRHGLKPKRGILGPKKELWDLFQMVEKWTYEALDITASVRDLPTVNTHIGRARAWLRLALMQKKLPDYFRLLLEHREDLLTEFYESGSLMLSDEAIIIMGLLVGLNVIDCNICVKEEDLDSQMGVIDFSLYLRTSAASDATLPHPEGPGSLAGNEPSDMTSVLDQKNYIEELNRHLNATVTNLQAQAVVLNTTNALMKEDLNIARSTIAQLQEENERLRKEGGMPSQQQQEKAEREAKKKSRISVIGCEEELQDIKRHLEEEIAHRKQVEREMELQVQMKAESEMAVKLLEKDIHEKQDTIVSLRQQLENIKDINLEMFSKLQECEAEISEKSQIVTRLQEKTCNISRMLLNLQSTRSNPQRATTPSDFPSISESRRLSSTTELKGSRSSGGLEGKTHKRRSSDTSCEVRLKEVTEGRNERCGEKNVYGVLRDNKEKKMAQLFEDGNVGSNGGRVGVDTAEDAKKGGSSGSDEKALINRNANRASLGEVPESVGECDTVEGGNGKSSDELNKDESEFTEPVGGDIDMDAIEFVENEFAVIESMNDSDYKFDMDDKSERETEDESAC